MKIAKVIAFMGLLAMTGIIAYGFAVGNFRSDGAQLLANPWGVVSMVDLYVGFILFSIWIAFRESNLISKVVWIILMMVLGNFTACLYVLFAINQSKGDWQLFFMGSRRKLVIK